MPKTTKLFSILIVLFLLIPLSHTQEQKNGFNKLEYKTFKNNLLSLKSNGNSRISEMAERA